MGYERTEKTVQSGVGARKTTKNCCPCCGSKNITIDVDITVGTRFEKGRLVLDREHFGTHRDAIDEAVEAAGYDQMRGFCYDCGADFAVDDIDDNGDGVYFSAGN